MKIVRNNKQTSDTWCGLLMDAGASHTIELVELARWQNDSKVLSDIASGNLILNDGTNDISDVASAINFLKDTDTTQRDSDGAVMTRSKITASGWNFQMLGFEIKTASANGVYAKDENGDNLNYFTYKMYDTNNQETQVEADAVKTVVDFEPPFDYEILGGQLLQKNPPSTDIHLAVIGVPDIPLAYGGSKKFIVGIDLAYVTSGRPFNSDGRAPKRLTYNSQLHTNKLRFVFNHGAGVQHEVMQILEYFRP